MFHLMLTTCFAGILCYATEPDVSYVTAERCLGQGAILSGLARVHLNFETVQQTSRIICSGADGSEATVYIGRANVTMQDFPEDAMRLPAID